MKKLFAILLFLIVFVTQGSSCSLCSLTVPTAHVSVQTEDKEYSTIFYIQWKFSREFTDQALFSYDINQNKIYESNELDLARQTLIDYIKIDNYLTFIKYAEKSRDIKTVAYLKPHLLSSEVKYIDGEMLFNYSVKIDQKLQSDYQLSIEFNDKRKYFDFILVEFALDTMNPQKMQKEKNFIKFYFYKPDMSGEKQTNQKKPIKIYEEKKEPIVEKTNEESEFLSFLSKSLEALQNDLKKLLEKMKDGEDPSAYFWLLLFSFLYGVIHAIGPGHGKSLVAAYFLGNDRSISKAAYIATAIGVVHTFSAFILTFSVFYILQTFLMNSFTNIEYVASKISAVIIIAIGLFLLSKKIKAKNKKSVQFKINSNVPNYIKFMNTQNNMLNTHTHSCSCNACKTTSTDLGVVLAAGIVPCAGTVMIFLFTMSLGVYFVGFLSAVFMSIGMSFIIFITAFLSIKIKKTQTHNSKLQKLLEYGSLLFIILLGVLLLIA